MTQCASRQIFAKGYPGYAETEYKIQSFLPYG